MPTRRFEQIALTQLSLSGCAIVFGACVLIARAQAQYVPPPAPPPPPVFNPSSPYTVPQRVTYPSRRQHQAPLQDMSLPRQRMSAYRVRPLALTEGHRPQKRVRSTTGPAPSSFVRRRRLIPTITRLSDMATVARGCGIGTAIGSEPRPVRDRKAASPKSSDHVTTPAKQRATFR
jgi:hypothetical protein